MVSPLCFDIKSRDESSTVDDKVKKVDGGGYRKVVRLLDLENCSKGGFYVR